MDPATAKQFLISRVIEEAEREDVPLSEIEMKMLYFTEVHLTTPDIHEVNAEFERDYDSDKYESKIAAILKNAHNRDSQLDVSRKHRWKDALDALKNEDHYILVMVYRALPEYRKVILPTHRLRNYAIYVAIGVAIVVVCIEIAEWSR